MIRIDITSQIMQLAREKADEIALNIYGDLLAETPVDTGQAKQGWTLDDSGKKVITIENRVPYIERLATGWSDQAPDGWIDEIIDYRTR
ncbi:hypothetical protein JQK15_13600 [Sphingobium sp. BHU LFT2]|uniref:hypothetical protein n=1 Tax=Sphingobium sp. BHU LFT2 TaxID=2807634 RepID=UPI001BEA657C|nr:hypothetical protein [Sphingobium sp. BHU LFT2]MBT2244574.1 hypothetical protein [Sphingobium sp. BHU LFT2]